MNTAQATYVRIWEFRVRPGFERQFEKIYGSKGAWARLFRKARGYRGTTLFRDAAARGRYLTLDYWTSLSAYETFRRRYAAEFAALDRECASLNEQEIQIGAFLPVKNPRAARA